MDGFQPCAHCEKTGTCKQGPNGTGCQICFAHWHVRYPDAKQMPEAGAIKCSTCWGRGVVEPPGATKWDYKTPAYLGALLAVAAFALLFVLALKKDAEGFAKALVFAGTLLGSITGYYFGGQKRVPAGTTQAQQVEEPAEPSSEK